VNKIPGDFVQLHVYPALAYLALTAVLFFPVLVGKTTFLGTWDSSIQTFAWMNHNFRALQQGTFALWDFTTFSGTSFVGELQTAPFYPLTIAFALFSTVGEPLFVDLFILLHFFLAAVFMHYFLRSFGIGPAGCVLGAVVFAFSGPVAARAPGQPNLHAGLVFLPLVLYAAHSALNAETLRRFLKWTLASGIGLGLMILAGHAHSYIHAALCLALFTILVPAAATGGNSGAGNRRSEDKRSVPYNHEKGKEDKRSVPWKKKKKGVLWIPWKKSIPWISKAKAAYWKAGFLGGAALVSLCFAGIQIAPALEYLRLAYKWFGTARTGYPHVVPFEAYAGNALDLSGLRSLVDVSRPVGTDDLTTLYVGLPVLVLVLVSFSCRRNPLFRFGLATAVAAFLIAAGGDNLLGRIFYEIPVLNLVRIPTRALHLWGFAAALPAALGLDFLLFRRRRQGVRLLILVAFGGGTLAEIYRFSHLLTQPVDSEMAPRSFYLGNRMVSALEELSRAEGGQYRFAARPKELVPPNIGEVNGLLNITGHRSSMEKEYADFLESSGDDRSGIWDRLGVKWVVTRNVVEGLQPVREIDGMFLYERSDVLPVFRILEENGSLKPAPIERLDWRINSVSLQLGDHSGGSLVFTQPVYPGWRAVVDGQSREISRLGIFTRIALHPGEKNVSFEYLPRYIPVLGGLSLLTLLAAAGLFLADRRRRSV